MRVLVCGGRDYEDRRTFDAAMDSLDPAPSVVINGGAKGADFLAGQWAWANDVPCITVEADWEQHGRGAGPIRNQQMLDEGRPDLVLAFPGGRGPADMVRRAKAPGVRVLVPERQGAET